MKNDPFLISSLYLVSIWSNKDSVLKIWPKKNYSNEILSSLKEMKKLQVEALQWELHLLIFYIVKIPFQSYTENPEHFSCQNIAKIFWKQAEAYKKSKPSSVFHL